MPQTDSRVATPKYAWTILVIAYLAVAASTLMFGKVPPLVPNIMETFSAGLSDTGLLVSVYGFAGLVLALPAGIITQRLGLRITGAMALGLITLGAVLGAVAGSYNFLLFSRVLEGIGGALIGVAAPAAIAMWFPPEKSGVPMTIWATSTPISGFITMSLVPVLEPSIDWSGVWWLTAGVTFVTLMMYWVFIRPAPGSESAQEDRPDGSAEGPSPLKRAFVNKNLLLLSLAPLVFGAPFVSLVTYYPTFLSQERGMPMTQAGMITGMIWLISIPVAPLAGWISDRIGSRKWVVLAGFVLLLPVFPLSFHLSGGMITVIAILLGVASGMILPVAFAAVPEALNDVRLAGIGMGVLVLGMNLGSVVGPPIFGSLVESVGWANAAYVYMSFIILGIVSMGMYKTKNQV